MPVLMPISLARARKRATRGPVWRALSPIQRMVRYSPKVVKRCGVPGAAAIDSGASGSSAGTGRDRTATAITMERSLVASMRSEAILCQPAPARSMTRTAFEILLVASTAIDAAVALLVLHLSPLSRQGGPPPKLLSAASALNAVVALAAAFRSEE